MNKKTCKHKWYYFTDFQTVVVDGKAKVVMQSVNWCSKCGKEVRK